MFWRTLLPPSAGSSGKFLHLSGSGFSLNSFLFQVRFPIQWYLTMSRMALGATQPPIQWEPGSPSLGVKQLGCEADHSIPSSYEVKNTWSYTSTPPIRPYGMVLS
jgi:hypothetical protein